MPAMPPGIAPPPLWGDSTVIRERLGSAVTDIRFDRGTMAVSTLSPQHHRSMFERTAGPVLALVEALKHSDPVRLAALRQEYEALVEEYLHDNCVRQDYLMTRATKA
jgi:hypothetical protein